ncbi:hypothetical protein VB773_21990 [Haloarculaceae archaeon H-GB2-1]|nr:hypothetical protein [Haloarculaceae archaeon H-GB11]MEA5409975.1 hypothetical protein [Haloarculaceae archaeon H-GB2-1]
MFATLDTLAPAGTVVDATYTYAGDPHETRSLLSGTDVGAADLVLARLLGVAIEDAPLLDELRSRYDSAVTVTGLDVDGIAAQLPSGEIPESTDPHPLVRTGYKLYTMVSGDVYPPQMRGGGE